MDTPKADEIFGILKGLSAGTRLQTPISTNNRAPITNSPVETLGGKIIGKGGASECLQFGGSVFFFFKPSTVVRFPDPDNSDAAKAFKASVSAGPEPAVFDQTHLDGFDGQFQITVDGRLLFSAVNVAAAAGAGFLEVIVIDATRDGGVVGGNNKCSNVNC